MSVLAPVLVTRPMADASIWVEQLRAQGLPAEALPLLQIVAVIDARRSAVLLDAFAAICSPDVCQRQCGGTFFQRLDWPLARKRTLPGSGAGHGQPIAGQRCAHPTDR